jgi:hypothetical protein
MRKEISKIQADRKVKKDPKEKGGKILNKEERNLRVKAIRVEKNALKRGFKFSKGKVFD